MGRSKLLSICKKNSICAEIGVWTGNFSQEILDAVQPTKLFLIDPWLDVLSDVSDKSYYIASERLAERMGGMNGIYESVKQRFSTNDNVFIYRQKSQDAVNRFENNFFDFVYIDGCHTFEQAWLDITLYWNKVRSGGILSGDDFDWGACFDFPVKRAVDKFFAIQGMKPVMSDNQWWAIKP